MQKNILKERFSKAIQHYDSNATAQMEICNRLFSYIPTIEPDGEILEIGCGTGNFSRLLQTLKPKELVLNDICPNYFNTLSQKLDNKAPYKFICCNALDLIKELKESGRKFNLIAAASVIQWIDDPIAFLIECKELLKPNGILAINTFTPNNIFEVTSITKNGLNYLDIEEYKSKLKNHYNIEVSTSESITLHFSSPLDILKHLKLTGVTGVSSSSAGSNKIWTKRDIAQFEEEYNKKYLINNSDSSYCAPLTYKPIYLILR